MLAAGSYGTAGLLRRCKRRGSHPAISHALGSYVRTDSEALVAVRSRRNDVDYSLGLTITSGVMVDGDAHVGGLPIGLSPADGVVDVDICVFGSLVLANLGVNPSLTISAMAGHALNNVPPELAT